MDQGICMLILKVSGRNFWAHQHQLNVPLNLEDRCKQASYILMTKVRLNHLSACARLIGCIVKIKDKIDVAYKTKPTKTDTVFPVLRHPNILVDSIKDYLRCCLTLENPEWSIKSCRSLTAKIPVKTLLPVVF